MKKIFNLPVLLGVFSILIVTAANAQNISQNFNYYYNYNSNLPTQVYNYIQARLGKHATTQQKITQLQNIVNLLNQKIADLQNTNGGGTSQGSFSANPTSGSAPLNVVFTNTYTTQNGSGLTLDYGDGQNESLHVCQTTGPQICVDPLRNFHTYQSPGTYIARVVKSFCPAGAQCFAPEQVLNSVTITVTR